MQDSRYLFLGVLALILFIGLSTQSGTSDIASVNYSTPSYEKEIVTSAITVSGDSAFTGAGFTGTGTPGDPYILDGVAVTTSSGGNGIYITGTTKHFIIQNCIVNLTAASSSYGIRFNDADNGTIYNCEIFGTGTGIYVDNCEDLNITQTDVHDCSSEGIQVLGTPHVDLINNTIIDITGFRGIELFQTPNVTISGNMINRINYDGSLSNSWGIVCEQTDNLTITNNEIRSVVKGTGVTFSTGSNIVMDSNVVWQASTCVRPYSTPGIVISNNNISCGYNYNLWMHTVIGAHVFGNSIHHTTNANGVALWLYGSSNNIIEYNDLFECYYAIQADSNSGNNTISDNNLGWCDYFIAWDDRTATPKNVWTSNQFSDFSSNPYSIAGAASSTDSIASLLTDSTDPTLDSPSDIIINDVDTDKWLTWKPDDQFPGSYLLWINSTSQGQFDWCNSSISISLDSLAPATYEYQIMVFDACAYGSQSDVVWVTVLDTQDPIFTSATSDYTIEYGERVWFNITATDDTPALKRAYMDGAGPYWNNAWASPLTLNWDNVFPPVGEHNYTIVLIDKAGNSAKATCIVTIEDTTAPTSPDFPDDFIAEAGDDAWVNFTLNEHYNDEYEIWLDDVLDVSLPYSNGEYISYMLHFDTPGEHNITVVAWDDYSNTMTDECIVTYEDSTGPNLVGPADFSYEAGETDMVTWSWTELSPKNYSIYENNSLKVFSTTFSGDIQYTLAGLDIGIWNITLIFYDETGNYAIDDVWVTVEDTTAPTLVGNGNFQTELGDTANVTWQVTDIDPWDYDGTYHIFVNGSDESNGVWDSNELFYVFDPEVALYNVTLIVTDAYGNSVSNTTWVTGRDMTIPEITGNINQEIDENEFVILNWTCSDLAPDSLVLTRDGTAIVESSWDGSDFSYNVTGLSVGIYNFTLTIFDQSGNYAYDTVFVNITAVSTTSTTTTTTTTTDTSTSTTTTGTNTSGTETPPPADDILVVLLLVGGVGVIVIVIIITIMKTRNRT
ncbi:MAG: right-handed parallel beta-helix repeat-containing protein [Candidatus Thorarchaeota archaeon]|nr:right-handed parallel beta-helix repeat-containing protein [Candidatus Thorarchaeota archaeon]